MWTKPRFADQLEAVLAANGQIRWVQLPYAGIEPFVHLVQDDSGLDVRQGDLRRAGGRAGTDAGAGRACAGSVRT